jgi:hypothetical protein
MHRFDGPYCNGQKNHHHHMAIMGILAMPGRVFHKNPILVDYAKVLVREITDMACIDYPLDHVTAEGIKELGEAVK